MELKYVHWKKNNLVNKVDQVVVNKVDQAVVENKVNQRKNHRPKKGISLIIYSRAKLTDGVVKMEAISLQQHKVAEVTFKF